MTDSLKERLREFGKYPYRPENKMALEALARIEELEQRGEELGAAVESQIIEKRELQGKLDRAREGLTEAVEQLELLAKSGANATTRSFRSILSDLSPDGGKK